MPASLSRDLAHKYGPPRGFSSRLFWLFIAFTFVDATYNAVGVSSELGFIVTAGLVCQVFVLGVFVGRGMYR